MLLVSFLTSVSASALLLYLTITNVQGSSQRSKPIKDIYHVTDVRIDVVNDSYSSFNNKNKKESITSQLCSQDSFSLHLSISSQSSTITKEKVKKKFNSFKLLLKPKPSHFFHPNAKITNYQDDVKETNNNNSHTEKPLLLDQVLIYTGSVYYHQNITTRGDLEQDEIYLLDQSNYQNNDNNWANIVIHNNFGSSCVSIDENLVFEGAFMFHNHLWHLKSLQSFKNIRRSNDSLPIVNNTTTASKKLEPNVVAWCDSYNNNKDMSTNSSRSIIRNEDYSKQKTKGSTRKNLEKRQTMASDIAGSMSTNNVNYGKTIGSKEGCPNTLKVVYMGIAVDCTYIKKYGGSIDSIRLSILNDMNLVSSLYQRTFNISIGILEIFFPPTNVDPNNQQQLINTCPDLSGNDQDLTWNSDCPSTNPNGRGLLLEQRLDQFSIWRSKKGPSDGAGLWHLMTDCPNGSEVGISWLGALCKVNAENGVNGGTTSGTGVTSSSPNQWQTMAHEIGHSFGAVHDCTEGCNEGDGCCPSTSTSCFTGGGDGPYIMAPSSTDNEATTVGFSACSIGNICNNLKSGSGSGVDTSCMMEPGNKYTISINQCGNGIIEAGEDCDPGTTFSPCCQWGICKFSNAAVCDPNPKLAPCCNSNCQFSAINSPCNSSDSSDISNWVPGTCPGNSPKCSPSSLTFN